MEEIYENIMSGIQDWNFSMNFTSGGLGLLVYILEAWALYTIAQRRCIKKPWLAWIPLVNVWILGSVSDQYRYVVKKEVKNKRKALLGLNIALAALLAVMVIAIIWLIGSLLMMGFSMDRISGDILASGDHEVVMNLLADKLVALALLCVFSLAFLVLVIVHTVYYYMALYDVFCSCEPKNSTMYLVLSLVGNVVVEGAYCIFLILCKDKDLGMPPRKPEPVPEIAEEQEPWEKPEE